MLHRFRQHRQSCTHRASAIPSISLYAEAEVRLGRCLRLDRHGHRLLAHLLVHCRQSIGPGGQSTDTKVPSASVTAKKGVADTLINAFIQGWLLHRTGIITSGWLNCLICGVPFGPCEISIGWLRPLWAAYECYASSHPSCETRPTRRASAQSHAAHICSQPDPSQPAPVQAQSPTSLPAARS